MMYCNYCGKEIHDGASYCDGCGRAVNESFQIYEDSQGKPSGISSKNWLLALLLCLMFGVFGVHRFYVGKVFTGILMLLTIGGLGIWALIDLIIIICGNFTDGKGKSIQME